jgi:hypothetical protein
MHIIFIKQLTFLSLKIFSLTMDNVDFLLICSLFIIAMRFLYAEKHGIPLNKIKILSKHTTNLIIETLGILL